MTTSYRTHVHYLQATPLGLLPGRWAVEQHCTVCRRKVATADLIAHAETHMAEVDEASLHGVP